LRTKIHFGLFEFFSELGSMFSVITPAYNAEKYIAQAIESVQAQGYEHWEMIIVDDGSTDRTREVISNYVAKDPRVKLVQNHHGGVSHARNTGVKLAKYEWIALLDADDVFCPHKMKKQLEAAGKEPDIVLWGTFAYNVGEEGKIFDVCEDGPRNREAFDRIRKRAGMVSLKNSSALFRVSLFRQLGGFDSQYDSTEDAELWNRMADHGTVLVVPEPLILYRYHSQSLSVRKMRFQYECTRFILARNKKKQVGEELTLDEFLTSYRSRPWVSKLIDWSVMNSNAFWRYAGICFTNKRISEGLGWLLLAFLTNAPMISWRFLLKLSRRLRYVRKVA
jgi:glycosyltransferase involved in cell wall biosynthesis